MHDGSFNKLVLSLYCEPAIVFSEVIIKQTNKNPTSPLRLSFPICKMGTIVVLKRTGCCQEGKMKSFTESSRTVPGT